MGLCTCMESTQSQGWTRGWEDLVVVKRASKGQYVTVTSSLSTLILARVRKDVKINLMQP